MSKKQNLLTMAMLAMLMSALCFASCVSETETPEPKAQDIVTRSVTFNIQLPSGDPVHVARTRGLQDGNEYAFSSLKLLVFDAATDLLLGDPIDMTTGTGAVGTATINGNNYQYTYTMTPEAGTLARRFVVVANDALTNVTANMSYTDFKNAKLSTVIAANDALSTVYADKYLPMTGVAHLGSADGTTIIPMDGTENATVNVSVTLTRCLARIDVVNNVPNLEIESMTLINANPEGYLMPHGAAGSVVVPTSMTKVGGITPATTIASITGDAVAANHWASAGHFKPATPQNSDPFVAATLKQAFYVYEDAIHASDNETLSMLVQGKLNNQIPVYYTIPFVNAANTSNSLEIQRNHLYTLTIGDGTAVTVNTQMSSSLSFADWTSTAAESVPGVFDASIFSGATTGEGNSYAAATQTFSLAAAAMSSGTTVTVANAYYRSGAGVNIVDVETIATGDSWTASSGEPKTSTADSWLTATITDAQTLTITTTANEGTAARTGSVRILYHNTNEDTTNRYIVFSVSQAGTPANP